MLLIVLHHYIIHGEVIFTQDVTFNRVILQILVISGSIGVNLFILISGYYMVKSNFKIKKLFMLISETLIYSLGILLITYIFKREYITISIIIESILPTTFSLYWFMQIYIILYLLSPFINEFINKIEKKNFEKLLIILFILQTIIPTITTSDFGMSNLTWFINMYLLGAYIRLYSNEILENQKVGTKLILGGMLIVVLSIIFLDIMGTKIELFSEKSLYMTARNKVPCLIISVALFIYFKNKKINYNPIINCIASTTLGVYLLHDNPLTRNIIWNDIIKTIEYANSKIIVLHALISTLLIFSICSVIDLIRQHTLEPIVSKIFDKCYKIVKKLTLKINTRIKYSLLKLLEG